MVVFELLALILIQYFYDVDSFYDSTAKKHNFQLPGIFLHSNSTKFFHGEGSYKSICAREKKSA